MKKLLFSVLLAFSLFAQVPQGGGGAGGSAVGPENQSGSFSAATSVTINHNLNTLNIITQCKSGASGNGADIAHTWSAQTVNSVTIAFASSTGICRVNGTGGIGASGATGPAGADGADGADGAPGANGTNGADGAPGEVQSDAGTYADGQFVVSSGTTGDAIKPLTGTGVVKMTDGVPSVVTGTSSDCVKVDGTSGACGSGGGTGIANSGQSFTAQTSVTITHNANSLLTLTKCFNSSDQEIPTLTTTNSLNSNAVTFNEATTGYCVVNTSGGAGTVTSVGFTGGLISVATATSTPAFTVAGTSGGIPYFSSGSTWATSGVLTANAPVIGGGAGSSPAVGTKSGNTTTFVTTTGTQTSGRCVEIDANGNHIAAAAACGSGAGTGDVVGPASSTDNAIARFDSTTGKLIQNSGVTIDDSNNITTAGSITTGSGGSNAGYLELTQGTAPTAGTTSIKLFAPTSVTSYLLGLPSAAASGPVIATNSSGTVSLTFDNTPDLGTPSAVTLTNGTGLPISTGVSGLGTGVATFLATPTSVNLGSALTNETGTGVVVFNNSPSLLTPSISSFASANHDHSNSAGGGSLAAAAVTSALASQYKTRACEIHIWGSGASSVLQDTDDEVASCYNVFGVTETITAVRCYANAGSPTVTPIITGGAGTSILTGALTCGTAAWNSGTLNGTPTLSSGSTIDANVTTAGGTATNIRLVFTLTR